MITQSTIPYAYDATVTELALQEFFGQPLLWPALYRLIMSDRPEEVSASFGGAGYYEAKVEGSEAAEDMIVQQFKKTFTHTPFAQVFNVSREARDDDRFGLLDEFGMSLGINGAETMEYYGALLFNNLSNTTYYTAEDGLSIANNAHLNADGANSQDNLQGLALNYANAKTVRLNMRNFKPYDANRKMSVIPDEIITGLQLEEDGWQLVRTSGKPGTANNDQNFFSGAYTYYLWPFLDWTTQWAMMASNLRRRHLRWYQRVSIEIMGDASFSQGSRKLGGYMRFANGCTDWRWIMYSEP